MISLRDIPIKRKLTLISMLTSSVAILLTCGAIVGFQMVTFRKNMLKEVLTTASMVGDNSAAALTFDDPASAELTLKSLDADGHLVAAFIYDAAGQPFASYQPPGTNALAPPPVQRNFHRFTDDWRELIEDGFTDDYLEVFREISVAGEPIGTIYLRHDMVELREELERSAYLALGVMLVAALVALMLARKLLPLVAGPILELGQVVREVAVHKDFSVRAVKLGNDEVGRLIDGFNEMLGEIQCRDAALQAAQDGLEIRVAERTEELATSLSVLNATLESTADGILVVDLHGRQLEFNRKFAVMWRLPPDLLAMRDEGLLLDAVLGQLKDPDGFTLRVRELYAQPDDESFDLLDFKDGRTYERISRPQRINGVTFGRVWSFRDITERKRAEEELRLKSAFLEALMESSIDGLLVVNKEEKKVLQNQRTVELMKIPPDLAADIDDTKQLDFVVNSTMHPDLFVAKVQYLYSNPYESSRDEIEFKDGMVLDRYSAPVIGKDGTHYGRIWAFRDITERKRSEAELQNANKQLLETSRQAGMAEVATSVLHNVGNVLNSVNVSCSVVADRVCKSRVGSVAKTAALLRNHEDDLAAFLTADPTGRKLPAYLGKLAEQLSGERAEILQELQLLARNVDHIKEIVAMQQSYAKVSGVSETLVVTDLVEDSLRMNEGSLANHGLRVVREYTAVPGIIVEKHKALQILVNLIRNAKHACKDSGVADKQIILRVTAGRDCVRVSVIDNGVGIPPENLTRIFAHGFTTKPDGHGFGLHSGALAAREMGGSLTVSSGGIGTGATYTLELTTQSQSALKSTP